MDCKEFEKKIPFFIEDKLEEELLPDFVEHVKHCKECEEELAIQYLTTEGLVRLEEGASFALDEELSIKVGKAGRRVRLMKQTEMICRNVEMIAIIVLGLTLIILFI